VRAVIDRVNRDDMIVTDRRRRLSHVYRASARRYCPADG